MRDTATGECQQGSAIVAKPLQGKYDGRSSALARNRSRAILSETKAKTRLKKSEAALVLKSFGGMMVWRELFDWAIQCEDRRLAVEIARYVTDQAQGKPFVSPQPDGKGGNIDNRLQLAIANLNVLPQPGRAKRKPEAALPASAQPNPTVLP